MAIHAVVVGKERSSARPPFGEVGAEDEGRSSMVALYPSLVKLSGLRALPLAVDGHSWEEGVAVCGNPFLDPLSMLGQAR